MLDCRLAKGTWVSLGVLHFGVDFFKYDWLAVNFKSKRRREVLSQAHKII